MALTANIKTNASQTQAKATTNLLDFVNVASSNIQEALAPKKKRKVDVRKFIQKRVKRLNDKGSKSSTTQTKTKSVLRATKPSAASLLHSVGSLSWPQLATPKPVQTRALPTTNYPTSPPSSNCSIASEPSLYSTRSDKLIDPELESLLSEFGLESGSSTRHSSDSFRTSVSPCYTPQPSLENQVYVGEHPYSPPNSDCSDDIFDDSAYSSPVGSVSYQSNLCSPPLPACPSLEWSVQSPQTVAGVPPPCPVSTSVGWFQQTIPSSGSGWISQYSTFDQGPPMTPTVSELLLDRASYF